MFLVDAKIVLHVPGGRKYTALIGVPLPAPAMLLSAVGTCILVKGCRWFEHNGAKKRKQTKRMREFLLDGMSFNDQPDA